ncbi:MAG: hypothetical protein LBV01_00800 [Deltaproteobacteria bacterium]|nr:hypothetical protein [Deltaproteobacteria bacterium]
MSTATAVKAFSLWLSERCAFLQGLEQEAGRVLQEKKDTEKYHALMRQKAVFLMGLPAEAASRMEGLPEEAAATVSSRLERFSQSAARALELDSVFYMYALLYPDEHVKGQPNNLELLAAEIASLAGK